MQLSVNFVSTQWQSNITHFTGKTVGCLWSEKCTLSRNGGGSYVPVSAGRLHGIKYSQ